MGRKLFKLCLLIVPFVVFSYFIIYIVFEDYDYEEVSLKIPLRIAIPPIPGLYHNLEANDSKVIQYLLNNNLIRPLSRDQVYNFRCPDIMCGETCDPFGIKRLHKKVLELLNNKTNGFFIESGSNDGELISNTLHLEKDYNWTGLLIEPDQTSFEMSRKVGRKAWLSNSCLSITKSPKKMSFDKSQNSLLSSIIRQKSFNNGPVIECFPLYSYLLALNVTVVDFLSLDIEGAEYEVLSHFPFDKITILVVTVETNKLRIPLHKFLSFMESKNFTLIGKITGGCIDDHLFAHNSIVDID